MATNLEIAGALKRTQKGNADWYYGGDNEAWADLASAKGGVPSSIRAGKTVGVFVSGSIVEYWWPTSAVADSDLIIKEVPLPQPLGSTDSPSFAGMTLTGSNAFVVNKTTATSDAPIIANQVGIPDNNAIHVLEMSISNTEGKKVSYVFQGASLPFGADDEIINYGMPGSGAANPLALLSDIPGAIPQDTVPTSGSTNNVQSGGVYTSIADEANLRVSNDAATLTAAQAYADALVLSNVKDCGNWDASTTAFPTTGGSGSGGAIVIGNQWEVSVAGTMAGEAFDIGDTFRALVDTPGQTLSNWARSEHNTQQATESNRGTAKLADETTVETESTTNDTDIITPKKLWFGLARLLNIARTITGNWDFTGTLKQNGNNVETQDNKATDLTSNDDTHYPTVKAVNTALGGGGGFEVVSNKVTSLVSANNTTYPSSLAVANAIPVVDSSAIILPELGSIITDDFNRAALGINYGSAVGTGTFSIVSNQLQVANTNSTYSAASYILYTAYGNSNLESFTATMNIIPGTINSTSFGVGMMFKSNGLYQSTMSITLRLDTGNVGRIQLDGAGYSVGTFTSINGLGISTGDVLTMTVKFIKSKYVVTVYNATTMFSNTTELDISTSYNATAGFSLINSFQYGFVAAGGTHVIDNWTIIANDLKNVNYLCVGDSITKGFFTDNVLNRWGEIINNVSNTITQTNAGAGSAIIDMNTDEILSLTPKAILVLIGVNDIGVGSFTDTQVQTNYAAKISALVAGGYTIGINLFPCTLLPKNGGGYSRIITFNTWLFATYGSAVIDFNTSLYLNSSTPFNPIYTYDGVHPNPAGHLLMADIVLNRFNLASKPKKQGNYFPVLYNANGNVMITSPQYRGIQPRFQLELIGPDSSSKLHIANNTGTSGTYLSDGVLSSAVYINSAGQYIPCGGSTAGGFRFNNGGISFFSNSGLTLGAAFTPTNFIYVAGLNNRQIKVGYDYIGPKALFHLDANGGTANNAPLKIDPGTLMATTEAGAIETTASHIYWTAGAGYTTGGQRYQLDNQTVSFSVSASGDGTTKTFAITWTSLGYIPSNAHFNSGNDLSAAACWISSITATGATINFVVAPASGTNNIIGKLTVFV